MPSQVALSNPFHNLEAQSRTLLLVLLFYLSYSYLRAFEPITSVNTPPVSDLIVFHSTSKLLAWKLEPELIGGRWSALNVRDLPEK